MLDFTFLTEEQCFGYKQLDILKPGENNAAETRLNENTKYNANMIIE